MMVFFEFSQTFHHPFCFRGRLGRHPGVYLTVSRGEHPRVRGRADRPPGGPRDKPRAAQEGPPTAHGCSAFLGRLSPPRRRIPWGPPHLCPYHTAPRLWCPEFPQIKTKPFINFCFLFASFPPGWGAEIKAQRRSQARWERYAWDPDAPLPQEPVSRAPGSDLLEAWGCLGCSQVGV